MSLDLASLGWDAAWATAYAPLHAPGRSPARVLRVDRGVATVARAAGTARASLGGAQLARAGRDAMALPAAGDWVVVRAWPDRQLTIEALLPRRTQVTGAQEAEAAPTARVRAIAANMDVLAVVEPIDTAPDLDRVARLLSLAWDSGARPIVLLTKADLARGPEVIAARVARATPALEVIAVSTRTGRHLARLGPLVADGQTLGLVGPAGAGKTALVDALAGAMVLSAHGRGGDARWWPSASCCTLVPLASGGAVLDMPSATVPAVLGEPAHTRAFHARVERFI